MGIWGGDMEGLHRWGRLRSSAEAQKLGRSTGQLTT